MLIVKITSGLGNQLFQYALAKSLSINLAIEAKLDISYFQKSNLNRNYELPKLNTKLQIANPEEIISIKKENTQTKIRNIFLPYYKRNYISEKSTFFDKNIFNTRENTYLEGYWQSEKYFKNIDKYIRQDFSFVQKTNEANQSFIYQIQNTQNSVAIHFRRGDYAHHHIIKEKIGVISLAYYQNAIKKISSMIGDVHLFIFSDEIEWVKENFIPHTAHTFVNINTPQTGYDDLRLMASCQHQIIANSTLSWWAAWLNANPEKIIIAPKNWFKSPQLDSRDVIPIDWICI